MNILFFLTPKSDVAYIFEDETLRQTVEKMEHRKFSCIPLLSMDGRYTGTISEGDILWGIRRLNINSTDLKEMENVSIMAIPRRATYKPVHADADMEDLLDRAINQNYVPVVDDQGYFIGIITRKEIIKYCYKEMKELSILRKKGQVTDKPEILFQRLDVAEVLKKVEELHPPVSGRQNHLLFSFQILLLPHPREMYLQSGQLRLLQ